MASPVHQRQQTHFMKPTHRAMQEENLLTKIAKIFCCSCCNEKAEPRVRESYFKEMGFKGKSGHLVLPPSPSQKSSTSPQTSVTSTMSTIKTVPSLDSLESTHEEEEIPASEFEKNKETLKVLRGPSLSE